MMRLRFRRTVIEATKVFEAVPLFRLPCMRRRLVPCVPHPCLKWVLACVGTIVAPVGLCTVQASELVVRLQAKSKSKAKHSIHRHAAHRSGQPCAAQGQGHVRQAGRQTGRHLRWSHPSCRRGRIGCIPRCDRHHRCGCTASTPNCQGCSGACNRQAQTKHTQTHMPSEKTHLLVDILYMVMLGCA
jgi:hypothetical protein